MRTWAIAKRVVTELLRDKRTLALMFVAPILILFLMKLIFAANSTTNVNIATVGVPSNVRTELNDVKHVAVTREGNLQSAKKEMKNQSVDAIIHKTGDNKYTVTYANTDATKTTMTKAAFKAALAATGVQQMKTTVKKLSGAVTKLTATVTKLSAAQAAAQAKATGQAPAAASTTTAKAKTVTIKKAAQTKITNKYDYGDKDTGFFDKIVPILMGFFVFFFVFLISGMALLKERTTGTLDRLLATPVKRSEIVFGYMLSYGLLAVVQTIIIVLVTVYLLGVEITGSLAAVMLINLLLALVALAFGILMSTFARSEFQMMQFIPVIVIPQVFFSGIIPLDSMADWVQKIAYILPLKYAGDAMTKVIMYGQGITSLGFDLGILLLFLVVLTLLNVRGLRRYRKV
ncbi:ABC transporter permease [Lacticaseibacillus sharpeae]|uniref:ABC-type multidrug transport system, permease component n=1 Tax=Lacticaseibacillus sharpeae JCM 1186 = DSM 20505 TaxID=1291052 RepID=A0A0R1ZXY5_9LACO|nr:ABC transporter permease [Lacticaseibacillus sharpeae]KRM55804.1 ABC-type multidrug transport system, permease component [Lacticaseibacillus sharpeae JCM 1186 = DSM 20505]